MATETIMPPVHPGEILLEEFLDPSTSASTSWRGISGFRLGGSTRSCMASAALASTLRCGWRATSVPRSGSG